MTITETKPTILCVDDEQYVVESFKVILRNRFNVVTATTGKGALDYLKKESVDIVLLDIILPDISGLEILKTIKKISDADVIMISGVKTMKTAVEAIKLGAYDFLPKPFDVDNLKVTLDKALEKRDLAKEIVYLKSELKTCEADRMIGDSPAMEGVFSVIKDVADTQSTVLITGESGTGKELVARAIHFSSARKKKPFVAVDCAAIPESLFESELFGHEKGSFTDATSQKLGKFELAGDGTIFLDEIGNLRHDIQSKILRVLETREVQRVGGSKVIKVDARIISATNIDLRKAVNDGKFRQDLYYRLNVIPVHLPPLRERTGDIPKLINYYIGYFNTRFGKSVRGVSKEALDILNGYSWPGNVRELKNLIERLVSLGKEETITHKRLPLDILIPDDAVASEADNFSLKEARGDFEKGLILKVLKKTSGNQTKAAQILGIHRNALINKIAQYGIAKEIKNWSKK